ncbi:MAG: hypothetical protein HY815_02965 [Candidatus Riflebacteria bacterium]|nr:hypothetical protein [Candidatus Riflebacteria bacterium]
MNPNGPTTESTQAPAGPPAPMVGASWPGRADRELPPQGVVQVVLFWLAFFSMLLVACAIGAGLKLARAEMIVRHSSDVVFVVSVAAALGLTTLMLIRRLAPMALAAAPLSTFSALLAATTLVGAALGSATEVLFNGLDRFESLWPYLPAQQSIMGGMAMLESGWLFALALSVLGLLLDEQRRRAIATTALVMFALCCLAVIRPNLESTEKEAHRRACFNLQRTIAGAIELYNQDGKGREPLGEKYLLQLQAAGYLKEVPVDPGFRRSSRNHFKHIFEGNGITCTAHGRIE